MALSRKRKLAQKFIEEKEALKAALLSKISTYGEYLDEEKDLIIKINDIVMSADGIAEQWGGYDFNPLDYLDKSIEIFDLMKSVRAEKKSDPISFYEESVDDFEEDEPCSVCGDVDGMVNPCCPGYDPLHFKNCGYG